MRSFKVIDGTQARLGARVPVRDVTDNNGRGARVTPVFGESDAGRAVAGVDGGRITLPSMETSGALSRAAAGGFGGREIVVYANHATGQCTFGASSSFAGTTTAVSSAREDAGRGSAASAEATTLACCPVLPAKRRRTSLDGWPSNGPVSGEVSWPTSVRTGFPNLTGFGVDFAGGNGGPFLSPSVAGTAGSQDGRHARSSGAGASGFATGGSAGMAFGGGGGRGGGSTIHAGFTVWPGPTASLPSAAPSLSLAPEAAPRKHSFVVKCPSTKLVSERLLVTPHLYFAAGPVGCMAHPRNSIAPNFRKANMGAVREHGKRYNSVFSRSEK